MMVSHEYNPIPMQDEQTQNYAAFMSDVHKTFLKSGETLMACLFSRQRGSDLYFLKSLWENKTNRIHT